MGRNARRMTGAAVVIGGLTLLSASMMVGGASASPGQAVHDITGGSATALAQSLVGSGLTVSNVTYTGSPEAAGTFELPDASTVGFGRGVVLSSGKVVSVVGPNENSDTSASLGTAGDADLSALVAPNTTRDAAVLEFDFVPTSTKLSFKYVFASEEYPEYVDTAYNDVFGFFINGKNCATIGSPAQPVAVNTVNDKTNTALYRDNATSAPTVDLEMDGLTTVLTCEADVNRGATNHIKLAIADTSDRVWDAAVFLQTGSFVANVKPVAPDVTVPGTVSGATPVTLPGTDADGDPLTYTVVTPPANGSLAGTGPTLTYTPKTGFSGTDSFTYQADDGKGASNVGTVTIKVVAGSGTSSSTSSTTTSSTTSSTAPSSSTTSTTVAPAPTTTVWGAGPSDTTVRQPGTLPVTGAVPGLFLAAGGALVLAGTVLLAARRRAVR